MMLTTRCWGSTAVFLCALLLQDCQPNSVSVINIDEEEPAANTSSASAMHQRASSEPVTMQPLTLPSASLAAHVPPSLFSEAPVQQDDSTALSTLATMGNSSKAPADLPAAAGSTPSGSLLPDGPRVCVSKIEEVLREMLSNAEEDSKPSSRRQSTNLSPEGDFANKKLRTGEGAEPDKAKELLQALLVVTQIDHSRQQALKALGQISKASSDMFSACLPSLRAAAKAGDRDVRLFALKTLGEVEWKHYFGEVEPAPDLPGDIDGILDSTCPFWPSKKVRDTHLLVLVPAAVDKKPFTLNLLEELIQHPKNGEQGTRCRDYTGTVKAQFGEESPGRPYWLLMTRDVLPGSRNKRYADQKKLVADHARRTRLPYELPKTLEAATAILTYYVRSGERLYSAHPWTFTRCQELMRSRFGDHPATVGGFKSSNLVVGNYGHDSLNVIGVAGCRKLARCVRREVLNVLLAMAESEPDKAVEFLDVLLVAAQDNSCRQQALEALGKVPQASPNMFSACLPSLRAAAKEGDKDVRLLVLKTLGEVEWKHYFGEVGQVPDLPKDMATILDSACPFWPGKKVSDTHLLVLIPATVYGEPFTLNLLGELIQHPNHGEHKTKYRHYGSRVQAQLGASSPAASYWLLMTRDVLPEGRSKTYADQKKLVAAHASQTSFPYELPKALEAVTAILTHHVRNGERLYGDSPWTFTRCQELVRYPSSECPAVVGGFVSSGLFVSGSHPHGCGRDCSHGVAGCRKF
jgi:hypothetical protein